jgi:hypothetical protein
MCIDGFKVVFPNQDTIVLVVASHLYILGMIPFEANHCHLKKKIVLVHAYLISLGWVY